EGRVAQEHLGQLVGGEAPLLRDRRLLAVKFGNLDACRRVVAFEAEKPDALLVARLDEPRGIEVPQQRENDAVRQADRKHREDDDRNDLEVGNLRLERVDTPGEDEGLDRLPDGDGYVEAKNYRKVPPERPGEFPQASDKARRLVDPLGGAPEHRRKGGPALE